VLAVNKQKEGKTCFGSRRMDAKGKKRGHHRLVPTRARALMGTKKNFVHQIHSLKKRRKRRNNGHQTSVSRGNKRGFGVRKVSR